MRSRSHFCRARSRRPVRHLQVRRVRFRQPSHTSPSAISFRTRLVKSSRTISRAARPASPLPSRALQRARLTPAAGGRRSSGRPSLVRLGPAETAGARAQLIGHLCAAMVKSHARRSLVVVIDETVREADECFLTTSRRSVILGRRRTASAGRDSVVDFGPRTLIVRANALHEQAKEPLTWKEPGVKQSRAWPRRRRQEAPRPRRASASDTPSSSRPLAGIGTSPARRP